MNINTTSIYSNNATAARLAAQSGIGSEIRDEFLKEAEKLWSEAEEKAQGSLPDSAAGEETDLIDQIRDPDSALNQDLYLRMRLRLEQSEEDKKEQAIIDALDSILEGMRSTDGADRKKTDMATSVAKLSKQISELDREDPRYKQMELFRQRLNRMGIYMDLGESIFGGSKRPGETLTQELIREKTEDFDPSIFDLIQ